MIKPLRHFLFLVILALLLVGCELDSSNLTSNSSISVDGAAVKGPLIGASVSAYILDTNIPDLKGELIALGSTNEQAHLDLDIPTEYFERGPFLIEFSHGTEVSGSLPGIETLSTVLTQQQLESNTPIYATPLTTFAIQYASKVADVSAQPNDLVTAGLIGNNDNTLTIDEFNAALINASQLIRNTLGLGVLTNEINLFTTSPILNSQTNPTDTLAIRTANEVFAAIVIELQDELSLAGTVLSGAALVERLAEDFTDGSFDKESHGTSINELTNVSDIAAVFEQNPQLLSIPGSNETIATLHDMLSTEVAALQRPTVDANLQPLAIVNPSASIEEPSPPDPVISPSNIAPTASFSSPTNSASFTEGDNLAVFINASDSDGSISYCDLFFDNSFVTRDNSAPFSYSGGQLNNLSDGSHTLSVNCSDNLGLIVNVQRSITVNSAPAPQPTPTPPANQPPTVSFAIPANNTTITAGGNITALLSTNDSDGTIAFCDLSINGTLVRRDNSSPYSYGSGDTPLNSLTSGNYTLSAVCTDNDGLSSSNVQQNFSVSAPPSAPTVGFTQPQSNTTIAEGESMTVAVNANDSDGNIAYCDLSLNGSLVRRENQASYDWGPNDSALQNLSAGNYTLNVSCADNSGLSSQAQRNFTVEAAPEIPPTVAFASPQNNTILEVSDTISVSINASDSDGSIAYCDLYIDGTLVRRDNSSPFTYGENSGFSDTSLNGLNVGNHTLSATCTDSSNLSASSSLSFSIIPDPQPTQVNVDLDWAVPTTRSDGTPLATNEIESYEVYYYLSGNLNNGTNITIPAFNSGGNLVTSHKVIGLTSGSYLFTIATVDTAGNVSEFADPIALTIQ